MKRVLLYCPLLALLLVSQSCEMERPVRLNGIALDHLQFSLLDADVGIHPDEGVLEDPNNRFVEDSIFRELDQDPGFKWRLQLYADGNGPAYPGAHVVAFYMWATMLVNEPSGEHQFYAGAALKNMYFAALNQRERDLPMDERVLAIDGYLEQARAKYPDESNTERRERAFDMAVDAVRLHGIRAFQKILDEFEDAVTYDDSGTTAQSLVKWAYLAIEQLGGKPEGWRREGSYKNEYWYVTPVTED